MLTGSPQLTRGTHFLSHSNGQSFRFIPAYAGNSTNIIIRPIGDAVHPRLRGELTVPRDTKRFFGGSSPLTRGTRLQGWSARFMTRFIPAYAGNSRRAYVTALPNAVHPRLRGELSVNLIAELRGGGSSPLTRGTQAKAVDAKLKNRFIPAYAGNSI